MKQKCWIIRLFALCLAVSMVMGTVSVVSATNEEKQMEELIAAQERAVAANEALMQYFFNIGWIEQYPEYFGGCYIEDNMLHIRLVSSADGAEELLKGVLTDYSDVVIYEYCDFSQSDLQTYADELANDLKNQGYGVTQWYVDNMNGSVVVGVLSEEVAEATAQVEAVQAYSSGNGPKVVIEPGSYICTELDILSGSNMELQKNVFAGGLLLPIQNLIKSCVSLHY